VGLGAVLYKKPEFLGIFPRQVGGRDPRDALGRHPSAGPRRWPPAGGPVAGAQLGILAGNLRVAPSLWRSHLVNDNLRCGFRLLEIISPDHLIAQDGGGATPGTSGSGRSMAGSEQHLAS
jgi:hypothetical protein